MLCPKCGKEMKKGFLCGRGYNYFLPEGEKSPNLLSKKILEKNMLFCFRRMIFVLPSAKTGQRPFGAVSAKLLLLIIQSLWNKYFYI